MSNDNSWWHHHLTPNGWVTVYVSYGSTQGEAPPRPADAVETWTEHLTQSSMYSATYSAKKLIWTSPDHSEQAREALHATFKDPFHGYSPGPLEGLRRSGPGPRQVSPKNEVAK